MTHERCGKNKIALRRSVFYFAHANNLAPFVLITLVFAS